MNGQFVFGGYGSLTWVWHFQWKVLWQSYQRSWVVCSEKKVSISISSRHWIIYKYVYYIYKQYIKYEATLTCSFLILICSSSLSCDDRNNLCTISIFDWCSFHIAKIKTI